MRVFGTWKCKKCHQSGGMFWGALHSHRLTWRRRHPGMRRNDWG
jgi:hypothetical protein